jgi:hypothetical protein
MEGILREPECAEIDREFLRAFDFSSPVLFFPVRHHSPACAFHLEKTLARYRPDCVLIEGPEDANHLIPAIADAASLPPFAIYYSYDDRKALVSEEREKYRAYYPFLSFSPEYAAVKFCSAEGIPVSFIDMPYAMQLINDREFGEGRVPLQSRRYEDEDQYERNSYTALLARKSGFRSYAEFWEAHYELSVLETEAFVRGLFHLAFYMRMTDTPGPSGESSPPDTPAGPSAEEPGDRRNALRESFMAARISGAEKQYGKILVVAGAYHVPALTRREGGKGEFRSHPAEDAASYLMPYTFAEMDGRKDYAAGMPFPAYYEEIWKALKGAGLPEDPFIRTARNFIVRTARFVRKSSPVSIPDEVNALSLADALARLRGKSRPGVYELIDGVQSAFVKGDINRTVSSELDYLLRILSGIAAGKIVSSKYLPPIVSDFRELCGEYRIRIDSVLKQETTLDILKTPRHYQKSRFLHRLVFLETGFCRRVSGPDYITGAAKNLVREIWEYRYDSKVESSLIDQSVFGATLAEAATNIAARRFKDSMAADELGRLLISAELMGLDDFYSLHQSRAEEVIDREGHFISAASCLESIRYLINLREILNAGSPRGEDLFPLLDRCFRRTVDLMEEGKNATVDDERKACEALRSLYALTVEAGGAAKSGGAAGGVSPSPRCDPRLFADKVESILNEGFCNSRFYGTLLAVYEKQGRIETEEFSRRINARLASSLSALSEGTGDGEPGREAASFIAGVFLVGRDILFTEPRILAEIDRVVSAMDDEGFLAVLPYFRHAFTAFLPAETDRLGRMAAGLHGLKAEEVPGAELVSREELALGMLADKKAAAAMEFWGL